MHLQIKQSGKLSYNIKHRVELKNTTHKLQLETEEFNYRNANLLFPIFGLNT